MERLYDLSSSSITKSRSEPSEGMTSWRQIRAGRYIKTAIAIREYGNIWMDSERKGSRRGWQGKVKRSKVTHINNGLTT